MVEDESAPDFRDTQTALTHRALALIQDEFKPETWEAFRRLAMEEHPVREIAADLGMSSGAVRQAKYRVLCRIRELLEGA